MLAMLSAIAQEEKGNISHRAKFRERARPRRFLQAQQNKGRLFSSYRECEKAQVARKIFELYFSEAMGRLFDCA